MAPKLSFKERHEVCMRCTFLVIYVALFSVALAYQATMDEFLDLTLQYSFSTLLTRFCLFAVYFY